MTDQTRILTSLMGKVAPAPSDGHDIQVLARHCWHDRRLALLNPDLINDPFARQAVINEANRIFGKGVK